MLHIVDAGVRDDVVGRADRLCGFRSTERIGAVRHGDLRPAAAQLEGAEVPNASKRVKTAISAVADRAWVACAFKKVAARST